MKQNKDDITYRNSDVSEFGEVFRNFLRAYKLEKKYDETLLIHSWEKIMGTPIAKRTQKIFIKEQSMYIYLNSAPLKQQLSMEKNRIIKLLNEEAGKTVIENIYFY